MKRYKKSPGESPGQRYRSSWKRRGRWRKVTTVPKYSRKRSPRGISVPCGPQCNVNAEQASKCRCRNRPAIITGKVAVWGRAERTAPSDPTGVVAAARMGKISCRTWETYRSGRRAWQLVGQQPARKRCDWFRQVADEGVVALIPGNAGGAKAL